MHMNGHSPSFLAIDYNTKLKYCNLTFCLDLLDFLNRIFNSYSVSTKHSSDVIVM